LTTENSMQTDALRATDQPRAAPLAYSQRNLWFIQQLVPESPVYNMHKAWRISGDLDVALLRESVALLLRRHESLRACVRLIDGEPVQIIPEHVNDVLEYMDLRGSQGAGDTQDPKSLIIPEVCKRIDLENGPVFRAKLLRTDEQEYIFFFITHHAFGDGWSTGVIARDVGTFYNALYSGVAPDLPDLPITYTEYAQNQVSRSTSSPRSDLDYWRETLADAPHLLDLPTDLIRPAIQRFHGGNHRFEIDRERTLTLRTLGREHGATLFMVLISVFKVLLYRFSGETDICVGTPFANRNSSSVENMVGLFVNTMIIRTKLDDDPGFDELITRVRGHLLDSFRHASTPLEQIIEQLRVTRDPAYNPLFQVMFVFQNTPQRNLELESLTTQSLSKSGELAQGTGTSKLDLSLTITEQCEALSCSLEFSTDLFVEETAKNLCRRFVRLVDAVCEHPRQNVGRIPLLDTAERNRMLFDWNQTGVSIDTESTVQNRFAEQVHRTPDADALIDSSGPISFRELERWSRRVAAELQAQDVRPGDVVAVIAEPSADWIAAMLGIMRAGGIGLPLESAFPTPRLRSFIRESGARVVLAPAGTSTIATDLECTVLDMPRPGDTGEVPELAEPDSKDQPGTAYIVFTSGSTGAPRAVAGTHLGIINRCRWFARSFPYGAHEICCHRTSPAFVDVVAEVFGPLLAGVPAVVFDREVRSDPAALISQLEERCITRISLTPTLLRSMLDTRAGVRRLSHLMLWVSSGEALPPELCRRFFEQLPDADLLNLYGSTEVAADATWFACPRSGIRGRIPAGRPLDNVKTYILDPQMQPVPPGFKGELYIGGVGVARGYWRQEAETAARFVTNPFDGGGAERMYKTGDVARYRPDGVIEILGRVDRQVKLHGIRLGVEEIEACLGAHPDVSAAVVDLWQDSRGEDFLAAWCVPEPGRSIDGRILRRYLGDELPRQWVPSHYVTTDALPRLASGKIDRRTLPQPGAQDTSRTAGDSAPLTGDEKMLGSIWTELLQCGDAGRHDNFFDLGGHSILVFRLLDRIETIFGVRLQVGTVFLAPTIADLTLRIRQASSTAAPGIIAKIRDRSTPPLVCVPAAATSVLSLPALYSRFDADQSFFAVEWHGLISGTRPQGSVEEMAQTYIDALRKFQPAGPYYLAGRCFGGTVAFEMARQLVGSGDNVAMLALLESAVPLANLDRVLAALTPPAQDRLQSLYSTDRARANPAQTSIEAEFERVLADTPAEIRKMMRDTFDAHGMAVRAYVPTPIDVPITVFRSTEGQWDERVSWDPFTHAGYTCMEFEGDRNSIFEPPRVHALSKALSTAFRDATTTLAGRLTSG